MTQKELAKFIKERIVPSIQSDIEWLQTTEEDEVECISIENLEGILSRCCEEEIKISEN